MNPSRLLDKLAPLIPETVERWRAALGTAPPDLRQLLVQAIALEARKQFGPDFRNRALLSRPPEHAGELRLGTIVYEKALWPARLSYAELLQHAAILGRSGAGKTNLTFVLLTQLDQQGIAWVFFDWKRTARHLLPSLHPKTSCFTPGRSLVPLTFNPFLPPPGLEPGVYASHVVDVLGAAYTLGDAARSLVLKALISLYDDKASPTIERLRKKIEAIPDRERVRGWKTTALRALDAIAVLGLNSDAQGHKRFVESLFTRGTILELDSLAPSGKKFLIPLLSLWLYQTLLGRAEREQLSLVLILEEAHNTLYRSKHETVMEQLLRQCRELGMGVIIIDQHPHLLSEAALGTYTTICLNLKHPKDVRVANAMCQLRDDDAGIVPGLACGEAIVKLQDRWRQPFLIQIPLLPVEKGKVSDQCLVERGTLSDPTRRETASMHALGRARIPDTPLSLEGLRFLADVATHSESSLNDRYRRLSVSAEKGTRIKRELLASGLVEQARIKHGRTHKHILRLKQGRDYWTSNKQESFEHLYWKRWYANQARSAGYAVVIEAPRIVGRMDILATRASESVAIEIETGKSNAIHNIKEDLRADVTKVIVVCLDKKAIDSLAEKLAVLGLLSPRVHLVSVGASLF